MPPAWPSCCARLARSRRRPSCRSPSSGPPGLIVDALVAAGHPVVPIHPNVVKACRPRYRAAGGKTDPGDAYLLADILRTDGHRFRAARARLRRDQGAARPGARPRRPGRRRASASPTSCAACSRASGPAPPPIFADIDSPIALAFVQRYPTPESAARLGEKRLAAFLASTPTAAAARPAELLARLRAAPTGLAGEAEADAKGEIVRALVAVLERLVAEIAELSARIEHAVADLPDGRIVMSFPRAGRICAAQILAELGDVRERFPTDDQLAAEAGVCPVTHASGKSRGVVFRWACNHRLRAAVTCFADNSRHASPWAAAIYIVPSHSWNETLSPAIKASMKALYCSRVSGQLT